MLELRTKVQVKKLSEEEREFVEGLYCEEMLPYEGRTGVIVGSDKQGGKRIYEVEFDATTSWWWAKEWLDLA